MTEGIQVSLRPSKTYTLPCTLPPPPLLIVHPLPPAPL